MMYTAHMWSHGPHLYLFELLAPVSCIKHFNPITIFCLKNNFSSKEQFDKKGEIYLNIQHNFNQNIFLLANFHSMSGTGILDLYQFVSGVNPKENKINI